MQNNGLSDKKNVSKKSLRGREAFGREIWAIRDKNDFYHE